MWGWFKKLFTEEPETDSSEIWARDCPKCGGERTLKAGQSRYGEDNWCTKCGYTEDTFGNET